MDDAARSISRGSSPSSPKRSSRRRRRRGALRAATPSSTTAVRTRLQGVIDAGAARLGFHAAGGAPAGVAGLIDHTLLKPDATASEIEQLCREAAEFGSRRSA